MKRTLIVSLARAAVQLVVVLWCLMPIVYWLLVAVTSIGSSVGHAQPAAVAGGRPETGGAGLAAFLGVGLLMFILFFYAFWCAVGVICGFGLDRTISTADNLWVEFFPKRLAEQAVPSAIFAAPPDP